MYSKYFFFYSTYFIFIFCFFFLNCANEKKIYRVIDFLFVFLYIFWVFSFHYLLLIFVFPCSNPTQFLSTPYTDPSPTLFHTSILSPQPLLTPQHYIIFLLHPSPPSIYLPYFLLFLPSLFTPFLPFSFILLILSTKP